ncbi:MAG: hypothetical protein CL844_03625 [Crocinitomicaceae bacterium]|nr:hypothetical protein [Crocinitomicaceae bacterium]
MSALWPPALLAKVLGRPALAALRPAPAQVAIAHRLGRPPRKAALLQLLHDLGPADALLVLGDLDEREGLGAREPRVRNHVAPPPPAHPTSRKIALATSNRLVRVLGEKRLAALLLRVDRVLDGGCARLLVPVLGERVVRGHVPARRQRVGDRAAPVLRAVGGRVRQEHERPGRVPLDAPAGHVGHAERRPALRVALDRALAEPLDRLGVVHLGAVAALAEGEAEVHHRGGVARGRLHKPLLHLRVVARERVLGLLPLVDRLALERAARDKLLEGVLELVRLNDFLAHVLAGHGRLDGRAGRLLEPQHEVLPLVDAAVLSHDRVGGKAAGDRADELLEQVVAQARLVGGALARGGLAQAQGGLGRLELLLRFDALVALPIRAVRLLALGGGVGAVAFLLDVPHAAHDLAPRLAVLPHLLLLGAVALHWDVPHLFLLVVLGLRHRRARKKMRGTDNLTSCELQVARPQFLEQRLTRSPTRNYYY